VVSRSGILRKRKLIEVRSGGKPVPLRKIAVIFRRLTPSAPAAKRIRGEGSVDGGSVNFRRIFTAPPGLQGIRSLMNSEVYRLFGFCLPPVNDAA
jgi:hypothetical protein